MSAQDILKMIEEVDPSDTAKLDEIDARVWCWLEGYNLDTFDYHEYGEFTLKEREGYFSLDPDEFDGYSRSRDALKSIRPEGWACEIYTTGTCKIWLIGKRFDIDKNYVADAPTEELAELHAIIQAIDFERTK